MLRYAHLVPSGARVLDVACGTGRHAQFFAARGCDVDAVDRDPTCGDRLRGVPGVTFRCADIEAAAWPYAGRRFDAVVVTHYLHRPLLATLRDAVDAGGVLIYETFAAGNERYGKPSNPHFLLRERELLDACAADLHVLAFEDGVVNAPQRARVQRLCAVRAEAGAHDRLVLAPEGGARRHGD